MLAATGDPQALKLVLACSLAALACATHAGAGEVSCVYEEGVLVAPASVAGVAGDYIIDTGETETLLHETRAQGNGFAETDVTGEVRLAGETLDGRPVRVRDLDARTLPFRTPIAGVIGVDSLSAYVVDISFSPCRLRVWRPVEAPAFRADAALSLTAMPAAVSDGPTSLRGRFRAATGLDRPVRLSSRIASVPGARPEDVAPFGAARPDLRALSFQGRLFENLPSGLLAEGSEVEGLIGAPVLSAWRLRFDFAAGRLLLQNEEGPPDRSGGPRS